MLFIKYLRQYENVDFILRANSNFYFKFYLGVDVIHWTDLKLNQPVKIFYL